MQKLYGYKQADVIALAKMIGEFDGEKISTVFERFSNLSNKAVGTVKNLYYTVVRLSQTDKTFCDNYLNGKVLTVAKNTPFDSQQEKWLIDQIKKGVSQGKSVRAIVNTLANGNSKLALRYQNKYRSLLVKNPPLARQIKFSATQNNANYQLQAPQISNVLMAKLKREMDKLIIKLVSNERKELAYLKSRVAYLEKENLRLTKLVCGNVVDSKTTDWFNRSNPTTFVN